MIEPRRSHSDRRGASRGRLLLPAAGAGLLIACGAALLRSPAPSVSVSEVARSIQEIALAGGAVEREWGAGTLGPWRIAASGVDPITGELSDFRLESGTMIVGARVARIDVDPHGDSFSFDLRDVVYTRVPDPADGDGPSFVHRLESYRMGPAPWRCDIVPDGVAGGERSPLAVAE